MNVSFGDVCMQHGYCGGELLSLPAWKQIDQTQPVLWIRTPDITLKAGRWIGICSGKSQNLEVGIIGRVVARVSRVAGVVGVSMWAMVGPMLNPRIDRYVRPRFIDVRTISLQPPQQMNELFRLHTLNL